MPRLSLALLMIAIAAAGVSGQSIARGFGVETASVESREAAAIDALRRLEKDVVIYRSLAEFEVEGRLARVSLLGFEKEFKAVKVEVELLLNQIPAGKFKTEITNALASYRDGIFWWRQIDQPRVVHVSALTSTELTRTKSDAAFLSTVPYTVAVHWRQAHKHLNQAEVARAK